jgi:hypothetical protein
METEMKLQKCEENENSKRTQVRLDLQIRDTTGDWFNLTSLPA